MKTNEPSVAARYHFALYLLSVHRDCKTLYPGGYETFLVASCAAMGNIHTGRAMNVSSIAQITGISRPTVIRKIRILEKINMATTVRSGRETKVTLTTLAWEHVRSPVANLIELASNLSREDRFSLHTLLTASLNEESC